MKFHCPDSASGVCTETRCGRYLVNPRQDGFDDNMNPLYTAACVFDGSVQYFHGLRPAHEDETIISDEDAAESRQRETLDHITKEANRIIAAKAPKRKRKFGHEGNGLKGPKTEMMTKQKEIFFAYLKDHEESKEHSRLSRAHELWNKHPKWETARKAKGEARGYSSYKALAAAK